LSKHFLPVLACMLTLSMSAAATAVDEVELVTTTNGKVNNYCLGGGDDRKLIPFDGEIHNPFKQTTHFGCESEGGTPTFMPDLDPAIKDGKLA
jgi:hypothetical protein